jgi:hypothetical protein
MVRDASKDPSREPIAEIFIFNNITAFEAALLRVNCDSADNSNVVIDKHKEVIEY